MKIPTHTKLIAAFGEEKGSEAYAYLKGVKDARTHPVVIAWAEKCYHDPRESSRAYPECLMLALDAVLGGYGVEPIHGHHVDNYHGDIQAVYINFGDTYDTTLLLDHETDRVSVTSYGDWIETHENRSIQ